jgi:3-hydroxyacyl-CoA dehydrogenase
MTAEYQVHGAVAVIMINNPPMNVLSHAVRKSIVDSLERAVADDGIKAVVLAGSGSAFSAGADIREFKNGKAFAEPHIHSVIRAVEESPKPVIAAIHAVCMGAGLELALGCHYRIAARGA